VTILPDDNLAYTLAGVGRKRDPYAERRALAQKMIMQGTDTSPVQSPWQGVGRLAQALVGGVDSYITDRDEKKATDDRNTKLAAVMAEQDPQKRIGLLAGIDPELGARLTGSLAVDQAKLKQQQKGLKTAAGNFGSSYGVQPLPSPGGGSGTQGRRSRASSRAVGTTRLAPSPTRRATAPTANIRSSTPIFPRGRRRCWASP